MSDYPGDRIPGKDVQIAKAAISMLTGISLQDADIRNLLGGRESIRKLLADLLMAERK